MFKGLIDKYLILQDLNGTYTSVFIVNNEDNLETELKETLFNFFKSNDYSTNENDDYVSFEFDDKILYLFNFNTGIIEVN